MQTRGDRNATVLRNCIQFGNFLLQKRKIDNGSGSGVDSQSVARLRARWRDFPATKRSWHDLISPINADKFPSFRAAPSAGAFDTYFMVQGTVVPGVHPDDGLQTGRRARGLRYWPAGRAIGLRHQSSVWKDVKIQHRISLRDLLRVRVFDLRRAPLSLLLSANWRDRKGDRS